MTTPPHPGPVFLSASVPKQDRHARYWSTANLMAIQAAVTALVTVILGRRRLVWGGHPSITPMILLAARARQIDYGQWVTIYQSRFYEEDYPEENRHFKNVVFTPEVPGNALASQDAMRKQMFSENTFCSAVFVGGMEGVEREFEMLATRPNAPQLLPIASTGGAARLLFERQPFDPRLRDELTYLTLFRDILDLPPPALPSTRG